MDLLVEKMYKYSPKNDFYIKELGAYVSEIYYRIGLYEKAKEMAKEYLVIYPDTVVPLIVLGKVEKKHKIDGYLIAMSYARQALKLEPSNQNALKLLRECV